MVGIVDRHITRENPLFHAATGYLTEIEETDDEETAAERKANIDELVSKLASYEENDDAPTLSGFLEEVALVADVDNLAEESDFVVLMTLHSAKGLEFPYVYLCGTLIMRFMATESCPLSMVFK